MVLKTKISFEKVTSAGDEIIQENTIDSQFNNEMINKNDLERQDKLKVSEGRPKRGRKHNRQRKIENTQTYHTSGQKKS